MSVEVMAWAMNLAPVPVDSHGKPSSSCRFVLVGLANHAGPDGRGAYPSVRTLMRYTSLSERTIRTCLDRLAAEGIITPCDERIVAARIRRADRRPQGWDLDTTLIRGDLTEEDLASLERVYPGIRSRVPVMDGVQPPHPVAGDGVQPLHPVKSGQNGHGVQPPQERGAMVAPEPSNEPSAKDQDQNIALFGEDEAPSRPPGGGREKPDLGFGEFYDAYPRHVARAKAAEAYTRALGRAGDAKVILEGAMRYAEDCSRNRREPQFIAHPSSWLNQDRWEDDYERIDYGPNEH